MESSDWEKKDESGVQVKEQLKNQTLRATHVDFFSATQDRMKYEIAELQRASIKKISVDK